MKRNNLIIIIGLVFLALLVFLLWKPQQSPVESGQKVEVQTNQPPPTKPLSVASAVTNKQEPIRTTLPANATPEERKTAIAEFERRLAEALTTPIVFYGKVVDESNQPIAGAGVNYNAQDKFDASGSTYHGTSDEDGLFSISNIKGATLGVGVGKEGYYSRNKSHGIFTYAGNPNPPPPTRDNPAVFVLIKMGETEPLIKVSHRQFDVPTNGAPITIDLVNGKKNVLSSQTLQIASWLGDTTQRKFDWRFQLSIPGGGLIERTNEYVFEAPKNGYQPTVEMLMSADAERWLSQFQTDFFAMLPDGTYARFMIRLFPGAKRNFIVLESYLNPIPSHRNLEWDPKKEIKNKL